MTRAILFMAFLTQFERKASSQVAPDDLSIASTAPQARVDPQLIMLPAIDATDYRVARLSTIEVLLQRRASRLCRTAGRSGPMLLGTQYGRTGKTATWSKSIDVGPLRKLWFRRMRVTNVNPDRSVSGFDVP